MFPSFLLSLREGLEAALIIGIVLGALRQMKRSDLKPAIWLGAGSAVVVSLLGAVALTLVGAEFEGRAEEIFEGVAMLLAAGILTWMIFWMRGHARTIKQDLETDVRRATLGTGAKALFALAFFSVAREGLELALFLVAASAATDTLQTIIGAGSGIGSGRPSRLALIYHHSAPQHASFLPGDQCTADPVRRRAGSPRGTRIQRSRVDPISSGERLGHQRHPTRKIDRGRNQQGVIWLQRQPIADGSGRLCRLLPGLMAGDLS